MQKLIATLLPNRTNRNRIMEIARDSRTARTRWQLLPATLLLIAGLFLTGSSAVAQAFPNKPIEIIVPWAAGGNADQQARILAKLSEEILGVPIFVKNQPGGGTVPGVMEALNAAPDGYTLIWTAIPSVATVPALRDTPYSREDLYPLANVSENTLVLYVAEDSDWYTLEQFIDSARNRSMNMAVNSIGALPHLAAVGLAQQSETNFNFVTEGSSAGAVVSLLGGHVDAALAHEPQAYSHGKGLRALAVFEPERSRYLPLVPTAEEQGYAIYGYVRDSISVNASAPQEVKETLAEAFEQAMNSDELSTEFLKRRIKTLYLSPPDTLALWDEAGASYEEIIRKLQ